MDAFGTTLDAELVLAAGDLARKNGESASSFCERMGISPEAFIILSIVEYLNEMGIPATKQAIELIWDAYIV